MARMISQFHQLPKRSKNCRTALKASLNLNSKLMRLAINREVLRERVESAKIISPRLFRSKLKAEASRTTQPTSWGLIEKAKVRTKNEKQSAHDKDYL